MKTLKERDRIVTWHPYTPMKIWPEAIAIVKGSGASLYAEDGTRYIDAIASWWVNIHGHSHPKIARSVARQMSILEHCMFAGFTHEPAVVLAERLLEILPGAMSRIFYSDNGSTAVEVALKMAIQYWRNKNQPKKKILALENAYHGDTFGAMAVSGRSVFTDAFTGFLFDVDFVPFPAFGDPAESLAVMERLLMTGEVAAFIAEPLVQGSAGMYMYPPDTLEAMFRLCHKHHALIIADEVMTGFGRTGTLFACEQIATRPDMICLSKGLTGGSLPMGVTATTQEIFEAFYDEDRTKMLYHGHSFTANPAICAAALASLDLVLEKKSIANRARIARAHARFATTINKHPLVKDVRQTGVIIAIELNTGPTAYHNNLRDNIYRFFLARDIIMRPLGNIIYILPPYCITNKDLQLVYDAIATLLKHLEAGTPFPA